MTVLIRRGKSRQRYAQRENNVKREKKVTVMLPKAKECLRLPEAGRGPDGSSPRVFRASMALPTPGSQTPSLYNCETIAFCV